MSKEEDLAIFSFLPLLLIREKTVSIIILIAKNKYAGHPIITENTPMTITANKHIDVVGCLRIKLYINHLNIVTFTYSSITLYKTTELYTQPFVPSSILMMSFSIPFTKLCILTTIPIRLSEVFCKTLSPILDARLINCIHRFFFRMLLTCLHLFFL